VKSLREAYGQWAIVTGGSSGMGAEFARQLAHSGLNLVLVARRKEKLQRLADQLHAEYGTASELVELDLGSEGAVQELLGRTAHLDIGLVVASAGMISRLFAWSTSSKAQSPNRAGPGSVNESRSKDERVGRSHRCGHRVGDEVCRERLDHCPRQRQCECGWWDW
jgi:NAD(P)-dependent dehydrogenase (short-subunit alcohol dehydrogenase family)